MPLLSGMFFIIICFACHSAFSTPVYTWSGKDSIKIDKWLTLEPVRLVGKGGRPIIDLDEDPASGNRLLCYLYDDYDKETEYIHSAFKPGQAYSFRHWKDHNWTLVTTGPHGWFRADKLSARKTDNAISFGVIDVSVRDTLIAGIRFAFGQNGFLFVNSQLLYSGGNPAGFSPEYMKAVKYVYLYPGLNRIALKLDDRDGAIGGKLLIFPPEDKARAIASMKEPISKEENRALGLKRKKYKALKPVRDSDIGRIAGPQDSLRRIIR